MRETTDVFISYSSQDTKLREELDVSLQLLKRQEVITTWHDGEIAAGTEWQSAITAKLLKAKVILLLISPDYVASEFCWSHELAMALERDQAGSAIVIPILLRPLDNWEGAPFATRQVLPQNAMPVTLWQNRDEAWRSVAQGIRAVVTRTPGAIAASLPQPGLNMTILTSSSHHRPIPEAVEAARLVAFEIASSGLRINLRVRPAERPFLDEELKLGLDLLVFLGFASEDGRLLLLDGFVSSAQTAPWSNLKLAILLSPHGNKFGQSLPCPWIALKGEQNTFPIRAFLSEYIAALRDFGIYTAAEVADTRLRAKLKAKVNYQLTLKLDRTGQSREVPVPRGTSHTSHGTPSIFRTYHFDFSLTQGSDDKPTFTPGTGLFVGRQKALSQLFETPSNYSPEGPRTITWVYGPAGMGKSALLREFASLSCDYNYSEATGKTFILFLSCHRYVQGSEIFEALAHHCQDLYKLELVPGSITELARVIRLRVGLQATHIWIFDDLTYLSTPPDGYEEAAKLAYSLREAAANSDLCLQLIVSSRSPGPKTITSIKVDSLERSEAARFAERSLKACRIANTSPQEVATGAVNLLKQVGTTANFVRAIFLAIDRNIDFPTYAKQLASGQFYSAAETTDAGRKLLDFELAQLQRLEAKHGFRYTLFLEQLYPLICRAGTFTSAELIDWFGTTLLSSGHRYLARIYQDSLDFLVRLNFLSVEERPDRRCYALPPSQRWALRSISGGSMLPDGIPKRGASERLSIALEGLAHERQDAIAELILIGSDYGTQLDDPAAAKAVFYSLLTRAELISEDLSQSLGLLDEVIKLFHRHAEGNLEFELAVAEPTAKAFIRKGMKLANCGRPAEALVVYDDFLQRFGRIREAAVLNLTAKALTEKAGALSRLGREDQIPPLLREFEFRFPHTADHAILKRLAKIALTSASHLIEMSSPLEAIALLRRLASILEGQAAEELVEFRANALNLVGTLLFRQGDLDSARASLDAVLALHHRFDLRNLDETAVTTLCLVGHISWSQGTQDDALKAFNLARQYLDRGHTLSISLLRKVAVAVLNRGLLLWQMGRLREAFTDLDHLTNPSSPFSAIQAATTTVPIAHTRKLELLWAMSRLGDLIKAARFVLDTYANHQHPIFLDLVANARYQLARALLTCAEPTGALAELEQLESSLAERLDPQSCTLLAKCRLEICHVLSTLGRHTEALARCESLSKSTAGSNDHDLFQIHTTVMQLRTQIAKGLDFAADSAKPRRGPFSPTSSAGHDLLDDSYNSVTLGDGSALDYEHFISILRATSEADPC